jgi:hypothetical protein
MDERHVRDRVEAAEIRAWGRDNGWPGLADRGRFPPGLREAFEDAHGASIEPDDDGEDLSAIDESGLDLPDDPGEFEWGDGIPTPPPPATLEEAREQAGRDPEPAHLVTPGKRARRPRKPPADDAATIKVTKAIRDDITGKIAFWLMIPAEPWIRVDPYCGGAYADNLDQIAVKLAPIICLSPDLVRWFSKSSTFILWTELAMACRPVAEAVIAHHVTRRITLTDQGEAIEQPRGGMDFSAYSSRQPNTAAA